MPPTLRNKDGTFRPANTLTPEELNPGIPLGAFGQGTAPATAAPAAAPEKKPDKQPKVDLTDASKLVSKLIGQKDETPQEKEAREKTEKEAADAKAKEELAKKAAAKPKQPAKPAEKPAPGLTAEQIAAATAEGVARGLKTTQTEKKAETPPPDPDAGLSAAQKRRAAVLAHMEAIYPERKGAADKYRTAMRTLDAYVDNWEKAHPDEEFDETATEHEKFFEKHDLFETWEKEEEQDAGIELAVQEMMKAAPAKTEDKALTERLSVLEREKKLREQEPAIAQDQAVAAGLLIAETGDAWKKAVSGTPAANAAALDELRKNDPVGYELRIKNMQAVQLEARAFYEIMNGYRDPDLTSPVQNADGSQNIRAAVDQTVSRFFDEQTAKLMALPADQRDDGKGRTFLPAPDYYKMPKETREKLHWTFGYKDMIALRAADLASKLKAEEAANEAVFKRMAAARGIDLGDKGDKTTQTTDEETVETAPPAARKPASPSGVGGPRMSPSGTRTGRTAIDGASALVFRGLHGKG
jgi:hypothetical protein